MSSTLQPPPAGQQFQLQPVPKNDQPLASLPPSSQTPYNPSTQSPLPPLPPTTPPPPPGPSSQHASPLPPTPRQAANPRFAHRRWGDPALSSEGGLRAKQPPSHVHTPSGGTLPMNSPTQASPQQQNPAVAVQAAVQRRQGKPIFEWFRGKLGTRRSSDAEHTREAAVANLRRPANSKANPATYVQTLPSQASQPAPLPSPTLPTSRPARDSIESTPFSQESMSLRSYSMSFTNNPPSERRRELNNPYPSLPIPLVRRSYPASTIDSESRHRSMSLLSRSRTSSLISLSSMANRHPRISIADNDSTRESLRYSHYADEDASVRPIPPSPTRSMSIASRPEPMRADSFPHRVLGSSPPPQPDRRDTLSSMGAPHSLTSDEGLRSRQNSLASTKPTTVMSFDSVPPVGHIAVTSSIMNSSPPVSRSLPSPTNGSAGQSVSSPVSPTFLPPAALPPDDVRVPRHTRYHPRNNPHPASPPAPDASTVTLASSNFNVPPDRGGRPSSVRSPTSTTWQGLNGPHAATSPTVAFADAPGSMHDGLSTHAWSVNARSRGYGRCDDDASMRAVRRRGSWESGESRWSWRPGTESASMFAALNRSGTHPEVEEPTTNNRSSVYTRESFRTAYSTWTGPVETDSGELSTVTSDAGLTSLRPVSVRAV